MDRFEATAEVGLAQTMIVTALIFQAATVSLPFAWLEYCGRTMEIGCRVDRISQTDVAWVNYSINAGIRPADDDLQHDVWTAFPEDRRGDCDDYVMSKRRALIALGMPVDRLSIVAGTADRPDGRREKHLILEWRDDNGDVWVLDNLDPASIYPPGDGPYTFIEESRQGAGVLWDVNPRPENQK